MSNYRAEIWQQWDRQANSMEVMHRRLSNLYLSVERGDTPLTIKVGAELRTLAGMIYPVGQSVFDTHFNEWWMGEFMKLEGWLDV
jgi:hypothetical protein